MEHSPLLVQTLYENCLHGQSLYFETYPDEENRPADFERIFILRDLEGRFKVESIYYEDDSDYGQYTTFPYQPQYSFFNEKELRHYLDSINWIKKVYKGGLPFLFKAHYTEIEQFSKKSKSKRNPFSSCIFSHYLTTDTFSFPRYEVAKDLKIKPYEIGEENADKSLALYASCNPLDLGNTLIPLQPPFLILNNRCFLFREKDCITLLPYDDDRIEHMNESIESSEDLFYWKILEVATQKVVNLGVVDSKTGHHLCFANEKSVTNVPIYREYLNLIFT